MGNKDSGEWSGLCCFGRIGFPLRSPPANRLLMSIRSLRFALAWTTTPDAILRPPKKLLALQSAGVNLDRNGFFASKAPKAITAKTKPPKNSPII